MVEGLNGAASVAVSPNGAQVYVAGAVDHAVVGFRRDSGTGALTFDLAYLGSAHSPTPPGGGIEGLTGVRTIAISPDGQHLLAAGTDADKLVVFRRNGATGLLTFSEVLRDNSPPVDGLAGIVGLAFSPDPDGDGPSGGTHLYTTAPEESTGHIGSWSRRQPDPAFAFVEVEKDGVNDPADPGGTVNGLYGARAVAASPDGKNLYAAGFGDNAGAVFTRDAASGSIPATRPLHLSFVQAVVDGTGGVDGLAGATAVAVSPDNQHVYFAGQSDNAVAAFTRNPSTGALTFLEVKRDGVGGVDGLAGASGLALSPDGSSLYAAGQYDGAVAVFRRGSDGRLTFLQRLVNGTGGVEGLSGVTAVAVSSDGAHVYAVSRVSDALVAFRRAANGQLTFQQVRYDGVACDGLDQAQSVAVSQDGGHVYVAAAADDSVAAFRRDTDNTSATFGSLTFVAVYRDGDAGLDGLDGARAVAVSPDNRNVYVAGEHDGALAVFDRVTNDSSSAYGTLSLVEARFDGVDGVDGLYQPFGVAVSADSRNAYVASLGDSAVAAFIRRAGSSCSASGTGNVEDTVDIGFGGSLTYTLTATVKPGAVGDPVNGTLINAAAVAPPAGITDPDLTNNLSTDVDLLMRRADLAVAKSDGATSAVAGEDLTYTITVTNAGPSNELDATLTDIFPVDLAAATWTCEAVGSGSLTEIEVEVDGVGGVTGLDGASALAISPDGTHVYATGMASNALAVFERDLSSGELAPVQTVVDGGPVDGLAGASDVALSPDGLHVYVSGQLDDAVAIFSRNPADGTVTFAGTVRDGVGGVDGLDQAVAIAISADGASVYVAGANDDAVAVFSRVPAAGTLVFLEVKRDGVGGVDGLDGASDLKLSPDGAHLYVAGFNDGAVAVFARNSGDGSLTFVERKGAASTAGLDGASGIALSPVGDSVYVAGALDDSIVTFARNPGTGRLTPVGVHSDGSAGVVGLDGVSDLVVSPSGLHLYAAGQAADAVVLFRRDTATGSLAFVERVRDGLTGEGLDGVAHLAISPDADYLYTAAIADDAVAAFARPTDSACASSGAGDLLESIDVAAGGRVLLTVAATVVAAPVGVDCPPPLATDRRCVVNQATVTAAATDLPEADLSDNSSTDADYIGRRADLAITKDDGLAEYDGLAGATDIAVAPSSTVPNAGSHLYTAGAGDNAIGVFDRVADPGPSYGLLHFAGVVRDGVSGVDGIAGVSALVLNHEDPSVAGRHLYAAGPSDNAVAAFRRDLSTGELTLLEVERHGTAGVGGMLGASALALSPDGDHLYVVGTDSDAVVTFRRDGDPDSDQFGSLTFVEAVSEATGVLGLDRPEAVAVSPDGAHLYVASPLGDSLTVLSRTTDPANSSFGRLAYVEHLVDGTGGVDGLAGVSALVLAADGAHLYAAGPDDNAVALFERNDDAGSPDFGRLTYLGVVRDGQAGFDGLAGARALALAAGDLHLYVAGTLDDAVAILDRDPGSGALSFNGLVRDGDLQTLPGGDVVVRGCRGRGPSPWTRMPTTSTSPPTTTRPRSGSVAIRPPAASPSWRPSATAAAAPPRGAWSPTPSSPPTTAPATSSTPGSATSSQSSSRTSPGSARAKARAPAASSSTAPATSTS